MPELIEVELYRQALAPLIDSTVTSVKICHPDFVRPRGAPIEEFDQLLGRRLIGTHRRGKLLVLRLGPTGDDMTVGLRFGMTGRLLVDGAGPIDRLEYSSARDDPAWDRVYLAFGSVNVVVRDQRRLGSIELDPDTNRLGPDAATVDQHMLRKAIGTRTKSIKGILMDQHLISGLGNLLVDEVLWRASIDPHRSAAELSHDAEEILSETIRSTVADLTGRGGSHMGDTFACRSAEASCPRCAQPMRHSQVAGRSTWWCPEHQR